MSIKMFFKELLEYTYIFNNKVIDAVLANAVSEKTLKLLNHTINAQQIWNARIENSKDPVGAWDIRPIDVLKAVNLDNYTNAIAIVDNEDFDRRVQYTNSAGKTFENSVRDMMFHAVNHSTYHRGQIASDFKANGILPLVTDYIFYKREEI